MTKENPNFVDAIAILAKEMNSLIDSHVISLKQEIDDIINSKTKDFNKIERTLDRLLDCIFMDRGHEEFKRLNEYYETVNKNSAGHYWQYYAEQVKDLES